MLMSCMLHMEGKYIATTEEIAKVLKQIAVERFDFMAKNRLAEMGFRTDKDVFEAFKEIWPERIIEDGDIDYRNISIF